MPTPTSPAKKTSWKRVASSISGIIGLLATGVAAQFDDDPATVANWSIIVPAVITAVTLLFAHAVTPKDTDTK